MFGAPSGPVRWRTVASCVPVLLVLMLLASSSLAAGHEPALVLPLFLVSFAAGAASPVLGVVLVLTLVVLADAVMAIGTGTPPALIGGGRGWLAEVAFLGGALGVTLGLLRTGRRPLAGPWAARGYLFVFGGLLLGALAALAWDWGLQSWTLVRVLWAAIAGRDQAAPEFEVRSGLFLLMAAVWFRLVGESIGEATRAVTVWRAWLASSLVPAIYGLGTWFHTRGHAAIRIESLLDDVNSYGSYLVLTLFAAWASLHAEPRRPAQWLARLALVGALAMLLLSASRAAILAAALGGVVALSSLATLRRLAVLAVGGLVLLLAISALPAIPGDEAAVRVLREVGDPKFLLTHLRDQRQAVWSAATRAFLQRPIVGWGTGSLYRQLGEFYAPGDPGWHPVQENAHNYFLQLAAETGVVGVAAFGWMIWSALRPILGRWRTSPPAMRLLAIGALGFLLTCVSGHPLVVVRQVVIFWTYLAVVRVAGEGTWKSETAGPRWLRRTTLGIAALVTGLAFVSAASRHTCSVPRVARGPVAAGFAEGFDPPDQTGVRLMRRGGRIELCNGSPEPRTVGVTMTVEPLSVERTLDVYAPGSPVQTLAVPSGGTRLELRGVVPGRGRTSILIVEASRRGRTDELTPEVARRHLTVRVEGVEIFDRSP